MTRRKTIKLGENSSAPISAAVCWGDIVWVSGIAPVDLQSMQPGGEGIEQQATFVLDQLAFTLAEVGSGLNQVLRLECFLAVSADFHGWNAVFQKYFPAAPPARTTVVTGFAIPDILLEVQAVAGIPSS
jgi:2-iminobutanoate/2-iminopropanoate deaminase